MADSVIGFLQAVPGHLRGVWGEGHYNVIGGTAPPFKKEFYEMAHYEENLPD